MNPPCTTSVPEPYPGLWQRASIVADGEWDTTTRVYWMQTSSLYVDIRVPAPRPSFDGVTRLEQCSEEQRRWLAGQAGFAGCLQVEGHTCRWERAIDFQPPSQPDIGCVTFNRDGSATEDGVLADYREEWRPVDTEGSKGLALVLEGERRGIIVAVGNFFMAALDRRAELPAGVGLRDVVDGRIPAEAASLLHCELSFGRISSGPVPWQIDLSTLPFREGESLITEVAHESRAGVQLRLTDGILRRWHVAECSPGFQW